MKSKLKRKIKIFMNRCGMFLEFFNDYREYKKWNYNNPAVHTQNAQEAKILRQTHIIEKGLSLSSPRKGFGQEKIKELFNMLDEYIYLGYSTREMPFQNALLVLRQYIDIQKGYGYENKELNIRFSKYIPMITETFEAGIKHCTLNQVKENVKKEYPDFFNSRHSMRQFADNDIVFDDIKKAVRLAQKAPSACNRQATKVYYYSNPLTNNKLGELIAGNTGFDSEVKAYLVLTGNISAFYDTFERNQLYIEGGMFAMALMEALHYYGIASCALQNGEYKSKNAKFKEICGNIPDNEKIILFIAIGYYKDEYNYSVSKRKDLDSVLIYQ